MAHQLFNIATTNKIFLVINKLLVGCVGLEPTTDGLRVHCSTN
jgi:hypothetical protein